MSLQREGTTTRIRNIACISCCFTFRSDIVLVVSSCSYIGGQATWARLMQVGTRVAATHPQWVPECLPTWDRAGGHIKQTIDNDINNIQRTSTNTAKTHNLRLARLEKLLLGCGSIASTTADTSGAGSVSYSVN